ncbi:Hypothetical predicted protein [Podarcis lilfordi]|uniref:Uncharacterized protein n=1 Tax=Podarcis lilfordi TaxID=74358 RepID=A0AA35PVI1_9SAUR|nr:Hypothetical predicted protein [Podarcis lilfordi]
MKRDNSLVNKPTEGAAAVAGLALALPAREGGLAPAWEDEAGAEEPEPGLAVTREKMMAARFWKDLSMDHTTDLL